MKRTLPIIIGISLLATTAFAESIHTAAYRGDLAGVQKELQKGENVNAGNKNKETPLHFAASGGRYEMAHFLLKKGANVNAGNKRGRTALHFAALHGHVKVCELLMASGADVNASEVDGTTPYKLAKARGHGKIASILYRAANLSKKPTGKKPVAKKPAPRRPAVKKPVAKKPAIRKPAPRKPAAKKPIAKKSATNKPPATYANMLKKRKEMSKVRQEKSRIFRSEDGIKRRILFLDKIFNHQRMSGSISFGDIMEKLKGYDKNKNGRLEASEVPDIILPGVL